MIAYILTNVLLQGLIIIFSKSFKYTLKVTYSHVTVLPHDIHYWSLPRVVVIYFIPNIFCLILGIIIFNLLVSENQIVNRFRLFLFWFALCLVNTFFAHLLFSPFGIGGKSMTFYQSFAIVGSWMGFNPGIMSGLAVLAIIAGILWGVAICKEVLRFSFSSKLIATQKGKHIIVLQFVIVPMIISFIPMIALFQFNYIPLASFSFISMLFIIFGMLVRNTTNWTVVRCNREDVLNHFPIIELIVCVPLWLVIFIYFK